MCCLGEQEHPPPHVPPSFMVPCTLFGAVDCKIHPSIPPPSPVPRCRIALDPPLTQPGCLRIVFTPAPRPHDAGGPSDNGGGTAPAGGTILYDTAALLVVPEPVAEELRELVQVRARACVKEALHRPSTMGGGPGPSANGKPNRVESKEDRRRTKLQTEPPMSRAIPIPHKLHVCGGCVLLLRPLWLLSKGGETGGGSRICGPIRMKTLRQVQRDAKMGSEGSNRHSNGFGLVGLVGLGWLTGL
jgi:hypothetical protein